MHFSCRSFIGHPSDTSWSQFWEMEPDDPVLVSRRGHLFGLINFSADTASAQGRQIINQINESYYSSVDTGIISQLQTTLNQFVGPSSDQLSLILAVVIGDQLHLAIFSSGRCILQRGNQISSLLTGQSGLTTTISGQTADDDRFLLCTENFYQNFSWENIKSSLSAPKIDNVEENFLSRLYTLDGQSQLAAALVEIHQDSGDRPETILSPPPSPEIISPPLSKHNFSFPSLFHRPRPSYIAHLDSPSVTRRKKINFLLALVILIALFVSIYFGYRRNLSQNLENQYQALKTQLIAKINNAQTVKSLSLSDALTQSQEAQSLLQKMAPYQKNHAAEIGQFQQTITTLLSQTGSAASFTPDLFFDTSLINNGLPYSQMTLSGNNLYLLDAVNGHIDQLDISNKSHQNIAASDDIKNSQFIAENNKILYLLKGTQVLSVQNNQLTPKIDLTAQIPDFTTGEFHFWNGSLYVLSVGGTSPSIWKYPPNTSGFTVGQNWLKSKQSLPASPASFAINGSIWVVSASGTIVPYSLGTRQNFTQTAPANLTNVSNLVISLNSSILAFTDQGNQVYVYNQNGQSVGQYNFGNLQILSLAYDQTSNTIFVLCADKKLYKISL